MTTNYTAAARAAIAERKAINCKIFTAHCEGPDFTAAAARELFHLYRDSAAALIMAVADYRAAVTNSQTPDPAPVLTAARGYLGKFAPDRRAAAFYLQYIAPHFIYIHLFHIFIILLQVSCFGAKSYLLYMCRPHVRHIYHIPRSTQKTIHTKKWRYKKC